MSITKTSELKWLPLKMPSGRNGYLASYNSVNGGYTLLAIEKEVKFVLRICTETKRHFIQRTLEPVSEEDKKDCNKFLNSYLRSLAAADSDFERHISPFLEYSIAQYGYSPLERLVDITYDGFNFPEEDDVEVNVETGNVIPTEHAKVDDEWFERTVSQAMKLIKACDIYHQREEYVRENIRIWADNIEQVGEDGTSLLDKFVSHKNYNGNGQIVLEETEYNTGVNHELIQKILNRMKDQFKTYVKKNNIYAPNFGPFTVTELERMEVRLADIIHDMNCLGIKKYNGWSLLDYEIEYKRYHNKLINVSTNYSSFIDQRVTEEGYEKVHNFLVLMKNISKCAENTHNEAVVTTREFVEQINPIFGTNFTEGTKLNKVIWKIIQQEYPFMMEEENFVYEIKERFNPVTGEVRIIKPTFKDKLGDALNPVIIKGTTVLSINFIDYLTMSFGSDWRSCHNIDKELKAYSINGDYANGCCAAGPMSYALDGTSMVFYQLNKKETIYGYEANEYELALVPKKYRNMFHYADYRLVQSRVYPQSQDSSNELRDQFRNCVQSLFAEMLHVNNSWTLSTSTNDICQAVESKGLHYRDYEHSSFSPSLSTLRNVNKTFTRIKIGHDAKCICCGNTNHNQSALECEDCFEDTLGYCEYCGGTVYRDSDYIEIDGRYYCCGSCAENNGYRYVSSRGDWYDEDDVICCERCGNYELIDESIETNDGYYYCSERCAENAGYIEIDGEWYDESDVAYCNDCGTVHLIDDMIEINTDEGTLYFCDSVCAENGGFIEVNGEWVSQDSVAETESAESGVA